MDVHKELGLGTAKKEAARVPGWGVKVVFYLTFSRKINDFVFSMERRVISTAKRCSSSQSVPGSGRPAGQSTAFSFGCSNLL